MKTRLPPHNVELEESLLGCPLIDPMAYRQTESLIRSTDFYIVKNGWIWHAYGEMTKRGEPIDFVLLCDELEKEEKLESIGGAAYVARLINAVPSALRVREYAARVSELAERRRTIQAATSLAKAAYDLNGHFATEKARLAAELQRDIAQRWDTATASSVASRILNQVEYNRRHPLPPGQVRHLSTGLLDVDRLLGGLVVGLHVVAAVTSVGKTAFCLAIAGNVAQAGGKVVFVSPEMTSEQLIERSICARARIDSDDLDSGCISADDYCRFVQTMGRVAEWKLVITQADSMPEIQAKVYRERPDLIILDGVERLTGGVKEKTHELRGEIADWAAKMAIDPDILAPILMPVQIATKRVANRADKRPLPGDVYHTSEIEYITDVMLTLHRRDRWVVDKVSIPPNYEMEVTCWKHRIKKRSIPSRVTVRFGEYGEVTNLEEQSPPPIHFN